jgi:Uma2 family endonuclease
MAYVSRERMPPLGRKYWRMAPDLAVEILSPSNSASDVQEKVLEYLAAGSRLVWIVDPARRTVTVYKSARDIRILGAGEALTGEEVLPGFRLPLAALFG